MIRTLDELAAWTAQADEHTYVDLCQSLSPEFAGHFGFEGSVRDLIDEAWKAGAEDSADIDNLINGLMNLVCFCPIEKLLSGAWDLLHELAPPWWEEAKGMCPDRFPSADQT